MFSPTITVLTLVSLAGLSLAASLTTYPNPESVSSVQSPRDSLVVDIISFRKPTRLQATSMVSTTPVCVRSAENITYTGLETVLGFEPLRTGRTGR
jgi:hypothetical protein